MAAEAAAFAAPVRGVSRTQALNAQLVGPCAFPLCLLARPEGPTFIGWMPGGVTENTLRDCGVCLWDIVNVNIAPAVRVAVGRVLVLGVSDVSGVVRVRGHRVSMERL